MRLSNSDRQGHNYLCLHGIGQSHHRYHISSLFPSPFRHGCSLITAFAFPWYPLLLSSWPGRFLCCDLVLGDKYISPYYLRYHSCCILLHYYTTTTNVRNLQDTVSGTPIWNSGVEYHSCIPLIRLANISLCRLYVVPRTSYAMHRKTYFLRFYFCSWRLARKCAHCSCMSICFIGVQFPPQTPPTCPILTTLVLVFLHLTCRRDIRSLYWVPALLHWWSALEPPRSASICSESTVLTSYPKAERRKRWKALLCTVE